MLAISTKFNDIIRGAKEAREKAVDNSIRQHEEITKSANHSKINGLAYSLSLDVSEDGTYIRRLLISLRIEPEYFEKPTLDEHRLTLLELGLTHHSSFRGPIYSYGLTEEGREVADRLSEPAIKPIELRLL